MFTLSASLDLLDQLEDEVSSEDLDKEYETDFQSAKIYIQPPVNPNNE